MLTATQKAYLGSLPRNALERLYCRLYSRMSEGGGSFGVDERTMNSVMPQHIAVYRTVHVMLGGRWPR